MDASIAKRLDSSRSNRLYDPEFAKKAETTARQYIESGLRALNYYLADFDAATDLVEMWAPAVEGQKFDDLDRNSALAFRHPMTFQQMVTMTTFIAQILFGGEQARSVEAQGPDDAPMADDVNALLAWNDTRLNIYLQGWLWVWGAVVFNRGVWYESGGEDTAVEREEIEEDDLSLPKVPILNKTTGEPRTRKGVPVMEYQKKTRVRNRRTRSGFYNRIDIVSPYDFICDPTLPGLRFQEGRFAGHRVMIPWHELKRRSELDPTNDEYVLPEVVNKIKHNRSNNVTPTALGGTESTRNTSRAYYERQQRGGFSGITGMGTGSLSGSDQVNKDDGGTVECFNLTIRIKPKTLGMYDEDDDFELVTMLVTSTADLLSLNVRPNKHDEFPYAVGEARPNAHHQFAPGWALAIKPCQDRVDDLNITHSSAQKRMGNILLVDGTKCDVSTLFSRDKNGLMVMRTAAGQAATAEECIKQIPLTDTTANYPEEMAMWEKTAENTTGANAYTQGETEDPSQTLGQFDATRQMAVGRISSIARMLAEQAISPQTRRFVCNLQQFLPESITIRVLGKGQEFDPENPPQPYREIQKSNIQGSFDVVPNDGSLPGTDSKVVAAAARTIEAYAANPALAAAFNTSIPGAIDPIRVFRDLLKKSGLPIEKYAITRKQAQENAQSALAAAGIPQLPGAGGPVAPGGPPAPMIPTPTGGIPSAAELPPNPSAEPPQLTGVTL